MQGLNARLGKELRVLTSKTGEQRKFKDKIIFHSFSSVAECADF